MSAAIRCDRMDEKKKIYTAKCAIIIIVSRQIIDQNQQQHC